MNVIVTPAVSVIPEFGLAVSHGGAATEYLTTPADALIRYSNRAGKKGPPGGPVETMPLDGVTTNEGLEVGCALAVDIASDAALPKQNPRVKWAIRGGF